MRCIVVEDEPLALERVCGYIRRMPALQLQATFDTGLDALVYLQDHAVDLVFLDINLGDVSGIELLERAGLACSVIITTAYDAYALKGYELRVTDYLLKPFTFERFAAAVDRAPDRGVGLRPAGGDRKFLFVKTGHRLEKVPLDDILYIEGKRDYRQIHTRTKRIMTPQTFGAFEADVPGHALCRVHKSWMVAPGKIDAIERDGIRIGAALIPLSDTYKDAFFELIRTL